MTVLSDTDIREELDLGRLLVDPAVDERQIQPASLDLRMGDEVMDFATGRLVDPDGDTFSIHPWRFYLAATLDDVTLPNDLTASIENRSTFARQGLIPHLAAGRVDPGWSGVLTLEMLNVSHTPVEIGIGERVVQLVIEPTRTPSAGYTGQFQGATGVERAVQRRG